MLQYGFVWPMFISAPVCVPSCWRPRPASESSTCGPGVPASKGLGLRVCNTQRTRTPGLGIGCRMDPLTPRPNPWHEALTTLMLYVWQLCLALLKVFAAPPHPIADCHITFIPLGGFSANSKIFQNLYGIFKCNSLGSRWRGPSVAHLSFAISGRTCPSFRVCSKQTRAESGWDAQMLTSFLKQ